MKKFTVKDFLLYACPCFGCGSPPSVHVLVSYNDSETAASLNGSITPTINKTSFLVDLKINYRNALSILIDFKTNKFTANDMYLLKTYLLGHSICLASSCSNCYTHFETEKLAFNLEKGFVLPVEMRTEFFVIKTDKNNFHSYSSFRDKITRVEVIKVGGVVGTGTWSSTTLTLPLLPCYQFKNKARFIKKMETYLTFS